MATETKPEFEALLTYIKEERGFDFTGYKRASLERRIARRMAAVKIASFEEYQDQLALHPDEFTALFNTILINVTGFFRDIEAWAYLQHEVLPPLLAARPTGPIRAWCAGCASGEEAYTLAMVLAELMGVDQFRDRVKIYATDVDEEALTTARQASYTAQQVQNVPEHLRDRYFESQGPRFSFTKDLRRSVIFGRNDLVQDAPISHVDVLTCRNTLMYFNAQTQAQILQRLHFALNPEGVLFLGKAEMLLSHGALFRSLELRRRFFAKVATEGRDRRLPVLTTTLELPSHAEPAVEMLGRAALNSSTSAQILLDRESRLVMANSRAQHLFNLASKDVGRPIQDLEVSYRPIELRSHIDEAMRDRRQVWVRDVGWARGKDESYSLDLQFVPLSDDTGALLGTGIVFNDVTHYRQLQHELEFANRQLETAYEELQSTNEELETTNEELQSTVEELETTNEELQSTNEELETMNEELQSMNDELHLSNEALQERQDEVDRLNQFMESVLGSMSAGIAVVDGELKVMSWNATAADLWGLRDDEAVGRHLFNLDIGLPLDQLKPMLRTQLGSDEGSHETIQLEAVNRRGRPVRVQVTVTRLLGSDGLGPGAIVVMNVLEEPGSHHFA